MVGADLRQWPIHNSQPRGRAEIPVPKPNLPEPHARLPFATSSSSPAGVDVQRTANAVFQSRLSDVTSPNNGMFLATNPTQQTRRDINQSSDIVNQNANHTLLSKDSLQDLLRSIEAINLPKFSRQPQALSVPPEQLRTTLLPVLLKNLQRSSHFKEDLLARVEVGLRDALTDQFCDSLSQKLLTMIDTQPKHGSKEDVNTTTAVPGSLSSQPAVARRDGQDLNTFVTTTPRSVREFPRAPRAMRPESSTRLTSQEMTESSTPLPRSGRRYTYNFGRPSEQEPHGSAFSARERRFSWDRPLQEHGIQIPSDPSFFTTKIPTNVRVKRESLDPSTDENLSVSRLRRSRSPHRRSLSASSRHSRQDTAHRHFSHLEISDPFHSRSPPPRFRDFLHSRSRSQSRNEHSPPHKRRRHTFTRPHSPPGSHHSGLRPRKDSFLHRQQSPPAHTGRRSRSPRTWKSFHNRDSSFRHRSPDPPLRRTPVDKRAIDRTRHPSPPRHRDSISDQPSLSIPHISRSPESLSTVGNLSHRHPSPSRHKRSQSPESASYMYRPFPSSSTRTRSRSPVRVSLLHRLSHPPDENHPEHHMRRMYMQGAPHINAPERSPERDDHVSTSLLNHERPTPAAQSIVTVKQEPDVEDFTLDLYPAPLTVPSPAVIPSPDAPGSPRPGSVSPMNMSPAPPSQAPEAPTHPPPARVSPGSPIDIDPTDQVPGHPPDIPEEGLNKRPISVERGADILPLHVSSTPVAPTLSEALPIQMSSQEQLPPVSSSSLSLPSQPSQPPSSLSTAAQRFTVPGLWFAKHGQGQADILDCEFEVNSEIVQKWHLPGSSTPEATSERLSLQLLCIPVELLQDTYQIGSLHELVDSGALTESMTTMKTVWPEQGSLIVQMNPAESHKRSWFPKDMGPSSPSLDITDSVHEGKNVLRLIQLEDMTNKIFMLQALLLPPTSQQDPPTYWDIADTNLADHLATGKLSPAIVEVI